jgi:pimeloyl-ACP methyl ester carboxylesterase
VIEPTTLTLDVPGAVLTYDARAKDSSTEPVLLLIGSPMGASGFGDLVVYFTDRTVGTYDPCVVERSKRVDGATGSPPDVHADDLHRLISASDAGPVDIFASSGGAVNALALVARHSEQVHTLVAHEPPIAQTLLGREALLAAWVDIYETYLRRGFGPAMAKFLVLVSHEGPLPADYADRPAADPAMFGLPREDDGTRDDPLLVQHMVFCTHYKLDFNALRLASTRIVMAARFGTVPVMFPGGHGGFSNDDHGRPGSPDAFAATLREVLTAQT